MSLQWFRDNKDEQFRIWKSTNIDVVYTYRSKIPQGINRLLKKPTNKQTNQKELKQKEEMMIRIKLYITVSISVEIPVFPI